MSMATLFSEAVRRREPLASPPGTCRGAAAAIAAAERRHRHHPGGVRQGTGQVVERAPRTWTTRPSVMHLHGNVKISQGDMQCRRG